jgi:Flp pilus assembly protein TadG
MVAFHRVCRRRGAAVVEFAIVAPVVVLIIFGLMVGGLGVARYQEIAHLARECTRYASTHGGNYQREGIDQQTGVPAVASVSDLHSFLAGKAVLLDPSKIQIDLSWTAPSGMTPANIPTYVDTDPNLATPGQVVIQNNVIVTLQYDWFPEAYLVGPITLTSTSEMPMSY